MNSDVGFGPELACRIGLVGQAILFGEWRLILYSALFWLACHLFVVAYEEPTLERCSG